MVVATTKESLWSVGFKMNEHHEKQVEGIDDVRQKRLRRLQAAELLDRLSPAEENDKCFPEWSILLAVPDWCFWPAQHRERLTLISGALFIAPAMRLWIDASRIKQAKTILGECCFDLVMSHFSVPHEQLELPTTDNVQTLLLATGSSVLLGATKSKLRGCLARLLPPPAGALPQKVSESLMRGALSIMATADKDKLAPTPEEVEDELS